MVRGANFGNHCTRVSLLIFKSIIVINSLSKSKINQNQYVPIIRLLFYRYKLGLVIRMVLTAKVGTVIRTWGALLSVFINRPHYLYYHDVRINFSRYNKSPRGGPGGGGFVIGTVQKTRP